MSSPLADTAALGLMRESVQLLMPESWILVHLTIVSGDLGDAETWTVSASGALATGNGARLMPLGYQAREEIIAARPGATSAWNITLPFGTPVTATDRIIIGVALTVGVAVTWQAASGAATYPRVYEVVGLGSPHTAESAVRVSAVGV